MPLKRVNVAEWVTECSVGMIRLLVSGQLQKEEQFYASFVEGGRTVKEFCQQVSSCHTEYMLLRDKNGKIQIY